MTIRHIAHKIMSGAVLRVIALTMSIIVAFFMMPFLIHSLGSVHYGMWILVASITGVYGFFDFGLSTAVSRYTSKHIGENDFDQLNVVVNSSFVVFSVLGVLVILLSILGAFVSSLVYDSKLFSILFLLMGINIGLQFPLRTFTGILSAQFRFDLLVKVDLFKLALRSALIVTLITLNFGIISLAVVALFVEIIGNTIQYYLVRKNTPELVLKWSYFDTPTVKQLIKYGGTSLVGNTTESMRLRIIPVFVSSLLGLHWVTIYSVAIRLLEYFDQLMRSCVGFMLPVFSRFEGEQQTDHILLTFKYSTIFSILLTVFVGGSITIYGEVFILLWLGDQFYEGYVLLTILVLPFVLMLSQLPGRDLLLALSYHKTNAVLSALEFSSILLLSFISYLFFNTTGVAIGVASGLLIFCFIRPIYFARALQAPILSVYALYIGNTIKASLVLIGAYILIPQLLTNSYSSIIICLMLQTLIFGIISYFFIIPKHLKHFLRNTLVLPSINKTRRLVHSLVKI